MLEGSFINKGTIVFDELAREVNKGESFIDKFNDRLWLTITFTLLRMVRSYEDRRRESNRQLRILFRSSLLGPLLENKPMTILTADEAY